MQENELLLFGVDCLKVAEFVGNKVLVGSCVPGAESAVRFGVGDVDGDSM